MGRAPKPSRKFSKAESAWIKTFQETAGAKVDGVIGRETLWHIRTALASKARGSVELIGWGMVALAAAVIVTVLVAFT